MKRVLVTGAGGFTGRYEIPLLRARGFEVLGASRAECDLRDARSAHELVARARPHYVVHLAGSSNLPEREAEAMFALNVAGTANLLEACGRLSEPPAKIILASSCFVYGDSGAGTVREEAPLAPSGAYGKSKVEMERVAEKWFGKLRIVIVRPFNYTGVGHATQFLVPKLVDLFKNKGDDASFVDANTIRDYSDVRWIASVYADLLTHPESGFAVNVCSGAGTPLPQLVELLEGMTGHRVKVRPKPAAGTRQALVGSPERLGRLLGKLSPHPLSETLRWMLEQDRS